MLHLFNGIHISDTQIAMLNHDKSVIIFYNIVSYVEQKIGEILYFFIIFKCTIYM